MPFDAIATSAPALLPDSYPEAVLGVPRALLVEEAMARMPPALRGAVAEIQLTPGGRFVHMGMVFDTVAWRAVWRRPGLPVATGAIPVWNGRPV